MDAPPDDRLQSWKRIAAYFQRGVRTVRRWEVEEGLPVHRHMHRTGGSVYAFKSELDAWQQTAARGDRPGAAGARASAAGAAVSIAVLPFANLSPDPENAYFADGLTDEVTGALCRIGALRVTSRTSAKACRDANDDIPTIARKLGVRYVVEGSVRRAGERLRISARLIDAAADAHVWADRYDGTIGDVFAFQERLARVIVAALELRLSADEDRRLAARPIADLRAYECYLLARQETLRWRRDAIDHAVRLLHNGLEAVGENAELRAALGRAHLQYREAGVDFGQGPLQEADRQAHKVFELDPNCTAGLQLRGWIRYSRGQVQDAVRDLKAVLEVEPNNADVLGLLSNCYLISGQVAAARPLVERLLVVDPLTPLTRCLPGWADILEGHFAAAVEPYRCMFEMDPGNPMARLFYVWVLALNRRDEAAVALARACPDELRDTVPGRVTLLLARALAGEGREALAMLTPELEAAANATELFPRFLAHGCVIAGSAEGALHWFSIAAERGFINYPFLARHDPFTQGLRELPAFRQLLVRVRRRWEAFEP